MLSDYLTLGERRDHCDLQQPCGKAQPRGKTRNDLLKYLKLTKADVKGMETCHLCDCDSNHGACSNPQHLYFGTQEENSKDRYYGHNNHPNPKSEAWLDPHCPHCGYQSSAVAGKSKRRNVKRHIRQGNCHSKMVKKSIAYRTHPNFQKGDK